MVLPADHRRVHHDVGHGHGITYEPRRGNTGARRRADRRPRAGLRPALPILLRRDVQTVTVIERNPHVIALVRPAIDAAAGAAAAKLTVILADVFTWTPARPGRCLDFVFIDIWPNACVDDLAEHKQLRLAYRRYLRRGGTICSWEYERLAYLKRRGRWR